MTMIVFFWATHWRSLMMRVRHECPMNGTHRKDDKKRHKGQRKAGLFHKSKEKEKAECVTNQVLGFGFLWILIYSLSPTLSC